MGRRSSLLIERSWREVCNPLRHVSVGFKCVTRRLGYASLVANARKMRRLWLVQGGYGWQSYLAEFILEVHVPIQSFFKRAKFESIKCFLLPMILLRQFFRSYPTLAPGRTLAH